MLLLIVFALVDFGSSYRTEEICYGNSYEIPMYYAPPLFKTSIYYKPRGEEKILVVNQEGKSLHKRFLVGYGSIKMKDLTEQDDGVLLTFGQRETIKLDIKDCQNPTTIKYGNLFSWKIPSEAQYLEFSKLSSTGFALKPEVIWNRTDTSSGRGTVKHNYFELKNLKQKDSGYYKILGSKSEILKWKRLQVEEHYRYFEHMEGEYLDVNMPVKFSVSRLKIYPPEGGSDFQLIEKESTDHRLELTNDFFTISDLTVEDSGTYRFIDDDGFLVLRMVLEVKMVETPVWVYFVILAVVVLCLLLCCCCVKKCCCKKSSNKRNVPEVEQMAPPVYHHDTTQSTQPVIPLLSREPKVMSLNPPTFNLAVGNADLPSSTQVTVPGGLGPTTTTTTTPMISTSSDSDPRFELKGMAFPSAPPLSSGTAIQDVYTSDKLNFL